MKWVTEANLQGTDTIAGCRCRCKSGCRKGGVLELCRCVEDMVVGWWAGMTGLSRKELVRKEVGKLMCVFSFLTIRDFPIYTLRTQRLPTWPKELISANSSYTGQEVNNHLPVTFPPAAR